MAAFLVQPYESASFPLIISFFKVIKAFYKTIHKVTVHKVITR